MTDRVLSGIPTRKRSTSGKIAQILAQVSDDVFVVSQAAETYCDPSFPYLDRIHVEEFPENFGVIPARNEILKRAHDGGYDFVVQSDDDVAFKVETIEAMITILRDNPSIGAVTSESRAYFNWSKDMESSQKFILAPCAAQLWAARVRIMDEIGPMEVPYLEDREHGCRLWKAGYAVVALHDTISLSHNPFISRTNVTGKQGGQQETHDGDLHAGLKAAIDEMNRRHGDMLKLTYEGAKGKSFRSRYNWNFMLKCVIDRFGYLLDYSDSRGRIL